MATHTNALKSFIGLFRNRMHIVQELAEVYKGDVLRGREKLNQLKELVKENSDRAAKSELARKMRVAKGYYTLEMAPPSTASEMKRIDFKVCEDRCRLTARDHLSPSRSSHLQQEPIVSVSPITADSERLTEEIDMLKEFVKNNCYKDLTVKQVWLLFLVGLEVGLWFFLGETIGKFHIVGYKVCP